jgi:hypothetical protein
MQIYLILHCLTARLVCVLIYNCWIAFVEAYVRLSVASLIFLEWLILLHTKLYEIYLDVSVLIQARICGLKT